MPNPNTDFTAGAILTAAQQNRFPRGFLGSATLATTQSVGTAEVDLTGMSVTFTAVAGRIYKFTGTVNITSSGGSGTNKVFLNDGSTNIKETNVTCGAGLFAINSFTWYVSGITAGSKTYKLRAVTDNNSPQPQYFGTSTNARVAAQFAVEDVGPA
jgi:hypothetical protein